jgi:phospholipid transport system substrate-binding protein
MAHVKDQKFEVVALAPSQPSDSEAMVRSRAVPARGEPILINYRLEKSASGWKIYDVNIMGVWLAETYRNSFSSEIARSGMDGLIKRLSEKNKLQVARGQ